MTAFWERMKNERNFLLSKRPECDRQAGEQGAMHHNQCWFNEWGETPTPIVGRISAGLVDIVAAVQDALAACLKFGAERGYLIHRRCASAGTDKEMKKIPRKIDTFQLLICKFLLGRYHNIDPSNED